MVFRGDLGLRVARRKLIPADRMPGALRHRMAERGDGEKLWDGSRQVGLATWNGLAAAYEWVADASVRMMWPPVKRSEILPPGRGIRAVNIVNTKPQRQPGTFFGHPCWRGALAA